MSDSPKRGFYSFQQPMKKTQPAKASDPSKGDMSGSKNTEYRDFNKADHDFNYKAKVTNQGGNFHDFGDPKAGLKFNGVQKDESLSYLTDRGMKGQRIRNVSGGSIQSVLHTNNGGVTAYPNMPIKEVYKSATSNKAPSENPVIRPFVKKEEGFAPGDQTKLGKKVRDAGK